MTPHEESLLLARGVEMWEQIARRWIGVAVENELRLLAAKRVIEQQIATIAEQHAELVALREELQCRMGVPKS